MSFASLEQATLATSIQCTEDLKHVWYFVIFNIFCGVAGSGKARRPQFCVVHILNIFSVSRVYRLSVSYPNKRALKNVISTKIKIIIKWINVHFFIRNTLCFAALRTQFKEYSYASFASFCRSVGSQYSAKVNPYLCAQIPRLNEYIPTEHIPK